MKITPQSDDAANFVMQVMQTANGILHRHTPETLLLVKIDNWFGSKWLGFSGKALGAIGVWDKPYNQPPDNIKVPPFVPNRVVSQRRFAGPAYEEVDGGKPLHTQIPSNLALVRKTGIAAPGTALVWYSGNSKTTGRGALMAYIPVAGSYWAWYVGFVAKKTWQVNEAWDIKREDLSELMEQGSRTIQSAVNSSTRLSE